MSGTEEKLRRQLEELKQNVERDARAAARVREDLLQEKQEAEEEIKRLQGSAGGGLLPAATSTATVGGFSTAGAATSAAGGAAALGSTAGGAVGGTAGMGVEESAWRFRRIAENVPVRHPPRFPKDPNRHPDWLTSVRLYLINEGLYHTLAEGDGGRRVCVINAPHSDLLLQHPENVVAEHMWAYSVIFDLVSGSPVAPVVEACATVAEAWDALRRWVLPTTDSQQYLLEEEMRAARCEPDEDPKFFFARLHGFWNLLREVGVAKTERDMLNFTLRRLPAEYAMQREILIDSPDITLQKVEARIRNAYVERRARELTNPSAAPSEPHVLHVGGFQSGRDGGGSRGHGRGYSGGYGGRSSFGRRWRQRRRGLGRRWWRQRPMTSMYPLQQQWQTWQQPWQQPVPLVQQQQQQHLQQQQQQQQQHLQQQRPASSQQQQQQQQRPFVSDGWDGNSAEDMWYGGDQWDGEEDYSAYGVSGGNGYGMGARNCTFGAGAAASSSSTVAAVPGVSAPRAASVGWAAGRSASLDGTDASSSTPEDATPDDSVTPAASTGGAVGRSASPVGVGTSSAPVAAAPGGRASSAALAGGAAGGRAELETRSSSSTAAALPGGRVSSTALTEEAAGQPALLEGMFGRYAGAGDPPGGGQAEAPEKLEEAAQYVEPGERIPLTSPRYWTGKHPARLRGTSAAVLRSGVAYTGLSGSCAGLAEKERLQRNSIAYVPQPVRPD